MTTDVHVWLDPSCPWAWQTMIWLRGLRDAGEIAMTFDTFSLEVNARTEPMPYAEAAPTYGEALAALALAQREGGDAAYETLYVGICERLHDRNEPMSRALLDEAAASLDGTLVARACGPLFEELGATVTAGWRAAREADVFGVPTLRIGDAKVVYGPILAAAPIGEDAARLWERVKGLADLDTFFELKRWPRDVRPGER
ncbi:MAG TPA: hypothetical protein VF235_07785 [Actinomycetota bacterium]